jgi:chemotaxis methyl-accepting protein methylase
MEHFDFIRENFYELIQNKTIKVLSLGCSSGEEPYSIAMTIADLTHNFKNCNLKIDAYDIDSKSLKFAKNPFYKTDSQKLRNVPELYLKLFFNKKNNTYYLKDFIKEKVFFNKKNIIKDSITDKYDMIFCKNMFIYFDIETINKIVDKIDYHLTDNGYIFVSSSDISDSLNKKFKKINYKQGFIFKKIIHKKKYSQQIKPKINKSKSFICLDLDITNIDKEKFPENYIEFKKKLNYIIEHTNFKQHIIFNISKLKFIEYSACQSLLKTIRLFNNRNKNFFLVLDNNSLKQKLRRVNIQSNNNINLVFFDSDKYAVNYLKKYIAE